MIAPGDDRHRRAPLRRCEPRRGDPGHADRDEQHQDRELGSHHDTFGASDRGCSAGDVEPGDEDDRRGQEHVPAQAAGILRQEACRVAPERLAVQGEHDDVAQPQQHVDPTGEQPGTERAVDERHRAAAARKGLRQQRIRPRGQQRHQPGQQKSQRRGALGDLHRQSEDREDAAADHAAHADRDSPPQPDRMRGSCLRLGHFRSLSTRSEHYTPARLGTGRFARSIGEVGREHLRCVLFPRAGGGESSGQVEAAASIRSAESSSIRAWWSAKKMRS